MRSIRFIGIAVHIMLMSLACKKVYAYDLAAKNSDGITIYYNYSNDDKGLQVASGDYRGSIVIPREVAYMNRMVKVTSIGREAFRDCRELTSVTIPNSVIHIDMGAFMSCDGLKSVRIPDSVQNIETYAFYACSNLASVTIGSKLNTIGSEAFQDCSKDLIVKVHVVDYEEFCSNGLMRLISESIGKNVMMVNDEGDLIKEYIIPDGVTSIGYKAFFRCSGLTSVSIPTSVIRIENQAFQYCNDLLSVTIPNSVTTIGDGAFVFCGGLKSLIIGKNVTSIGIRAFADDNISSIVSFIENPFPIQSGYSTNSGPFSIYSLSSATLYVPKGSIDKYKETVGWKDFRNIVEGTPSCMNTTSINKVERNKVYNLNGRMFEHTQQGINIVAGKKILIKYR